MLEIRADNRPDDEALLEASLDSLKRTGFIEFRGEYGNEVATFIPFVAWLKKEGLLADRRVITYEGMRPYYYFLDDGELELKYEKRRFGFTRERLWPSNSTYTAVKERWHVRPNYRAHYATRGQSFPKPVLFIQNKFTVEFGHGPMNYIPLRAIKSLLRLQERFHIVYSRPGILRTANGYSVDRNAFCDYPDLEVVREYDKVEIFEETCLSKGLDYNATKLEYLAKAYLFVSSQGGGAHIVSAFGSSLLLILHRYGPEYPHAYAKGPYKYLAERPPVLLVARNYEDFDLGMNIIESARVTDNGAQLPPSMLQQVAQLAL